LAVTDAPGLDALGLTFLLVGERREIGQLVEVDDDAGQYPEHTRTVDRDIFRLGIGLRLQVHHDQRPAVQALQPPAAPAQASISPARRV
jgi:hypothetical protein